MTVEKWDLPYMSQFLLNSYPTTLVATFLLGRLPPPRHIVQSVNDFVTLTFVFSL